MDTVSDAGRVRVFEPVPGLPLAAEPLFGPHLQQLGKMAWLRIALSAVFALCGVGLFLVPSDEGGLPYFYLVLFGLSVAIQAYALIVFARVRKLSGQPYHRVDVEPDGLLVAGSRVSARLPDGRWLRTRLTDGARVQLAGERRLWVLGTGERVFVRLPGALWMRGARIHDAPGSGAKLAEVVSRQPTQPRRDPVLAAHRRYQNRRLGFSALVMLLMAAFGFAAVTTVTIEEDGFSGPAALGGVAGGSAVLVLMGVLMLAALVVRLRKPVVQEVWVELRVTLDAPFRPGSRGVVRMTGWAMHPDGRQTRFRLGADISLAANVATTGQLWLLGYPQPGKAALAGLPGYPCTGSFKLA